jgi:hypothetical protein
VQRRPSGHQPHEVVLAVEIVTPTSQGIDRVLKDVTEPWPITLPVSRLTPRYL